MSKNGDVFTTTLRLNLKNPQDQEAWDNLMYTDSSLPQYSSYTRTIVTAINDHFSRMNHPEDHDSEAALLKKVEETIRWTMTECLRELSITPATVTAAEPGFEPDTSKEDTPVDENTATIEAFLDCF